MTAEEMSLDQAFTEGVHAGMDGKSWAHNPYQNTVPEHKEWERGRKLSESVQLAGMTA